MVKVNKLMIEEEIFSSLFNSGLTYNELQSALNCGRNKIVSYIKKLKLKREKPKPDYSAHYGNKHTGSKYRLSRLKSTQLKKCRNPECDFYYYGYKGDRYCCKKCAARANNLKNAQYHKKWTETHQEYLREYERKRRVLKKLGYA